MIHVMALITSVAVLTAPPAPATGDPRPSGTVESCRFATRSLPPPFRVPKQFVDGYQLFQAGGAYLPERVTVKTVVLMAGAEVGLTAQQTQGLYTNLDKVYANIAADPLFKDIGTALPYCLADKRPTEGHYFAYYPPKIANDTRAIVFLHGLGGNFLFYIYLLKEEFPEAVILVPSWSGSWHDGTMQYLDDMYADVRRKRSLAVGAPCLMAISAGGPAGFRLYNERPERFAGLVSIASAPPLASVPKLKDSLRILMVNGRQDAGFPIAHVESIASALAARLPHFQLQTVDGDHFFLLSKRDETFRAIKAFVDKQTGTGNVTQVPK